MNTLHSTFAVALLAAAATQPALAADDDLSKRIAACTREQDDARRLACFDRAAAPAAARAEAAEKVHATQAFGVHGSELARNRDDDDAKKETVPERITAKIAGIDKRPRGELVVTLDNGQVWAQKEVGAYFPIKVGDAATILAGTLGSYRLVVANRATAVTRVR
jgi:hypothetical protein